MRFNRCLRQRRRIALASIAFVLVLVAYLLSYPLFYRVLSGSDHNGHRFLTGLGSNPTHLDVMRLRALDAMERYYFPPAMWIVDYTPLRCPILWIAELVGVDEQMELQSTLRVILGKKTPGRIG